MDYFFCPFILQYIALRTQNRINLQTVCRLGFALLQRYTKAIIFSLNEKAQNFQARGITIAFVFNDLAPM